MHESASFHSCGSEFAGFESRDHTEGDDDSGVAATEAEKGQYEFHDDVGFPEHECTKHFAWGRSHVGKFGAGEEHAEQFGGEREYAGERE